jgi:hypothetical protein
VNEHKLCSPRFLVGKLGEAGHHRVAFENLLKGYGRLTVHDAGRRPWAGEPDWRSGSQPGRTVRIEPEDEFARVERVANKLIDETIEDLNAVRMSSSSRTPLKSGL